MNSRFMCCLNKDFQNFCCVTCNGIFHPSCLDRRNSVVKLGGYKIYCSYVCQEKAVELENVVSSLKEEIANLNRALADKDTAIKRLKRNTQDFQDIAQEAENKYILDIKNKDEHISRMSKELLLVKESNSLHQSENSEYPKIIEKLHEDIKELQDTNQKGLTSIKCLEQENLAYAEEIKLLKEEKAKTNMPEIISVVTDDDENLQGNKLSKLEEKLKRLESRFINLETSVLNRPPVVPIQTLSEPVQKENAIQHTPTAKSFANALKKDKIKPSLNIANSRSQSDEKLNNQQNKNKPFTSSQIKSAIDNAISTSKPPDARVVVNDNSDDKSDEKNPWKLVGRKKRNVVSKGAAVESNSDFKGVQGMRWLYIGKAEKSVTPEIVRSYISQKLSLKNDTQLVIEQLKTLGNTNSFKMGIAADFYERVNTPSFWPNAIIFRRFNFKVPDNKDRNFRGEMLENKNV